MKRILFILMCFLLNISLAGCNDEKDDSNNAIAGCFLVEYHGTRENHSSVVVIDYPRNAPAYLKENLSSNVLLAILEEKTIQCRRLVI